MLSLNHTILHRMLDASWHRAPELDHIIGIAWIMNTNYTHVILILNILSLLALCICPCLDCKPQALVWKVDCGRLSYHDLGRIRGL